MMARYYFAYGSNLDLVQMLRRCPAALPICRHTLSNYQLVFRHVADVIEAPGKHAEGAVYRITPECERALDRYEGWPNLYRKAFVRTPIKKGGRAVSLMFYVMNRDTIEPPPSSYLKTIRLGYDDWEIDHATLNNAVRAALAHEQRIAARRNRDEEARARRRRADLPSVHSYRGLLA